VVTSTITAGQKVNNLNQFSKYRTEQNGTERHRTETEYN